MLIRAVTLKSHLGSDIIISRLDDNTILITQDGDHIHLDSSFVDEFHEALTEVTG